MSCIAAVVAGRKGAQAMQARTRVLVIHTVCFQARAGAVWVRVPNAVPEADVRVNESLVPDPSTLPDVMPCRGSEGGCCSAGLSLFLICCSASRYREQVANALTAGRCAHSNLSSRDGGGRRDGGGKGASQAGACVRACVPAAALIAPEGAAQLHLPGIVGL